MTLSNPLSQLVVGTSSLGSVLPNVLTSTRTREKEFRLLDQFVEQGVRSFDIAASYQLGGTERLIGRWIYSRKNRDALYLITKGGHPYPVLQPHRLSPQALESDLHASLRRLEVQYVDLYLLHRDDPQVSLELLLSTMANFVRSGKIKAWGVSNWNHSRIHEMSSLAIELGLPGPAVSSPHFSVLDWVRPPWPGCVSISGPNQLAARKFYQNSQIPILAWSPLASGFVSLPVNEARKSKTLGVYGSPANFARKKKLEWLARKYDRTVSQIALAYLFSQPFPVSAVVFTSRAENIKSNLAATAIKLLPAELTLLEQIEIAKIFD